MSLLHPLLYALLAPAIRGQQLSIARTRCPECDYGTKRCYHGCTLGTCTGVGCLVVANPGADDAVRSWKGEHRSGGIITEYVPNTPALTGAASTASWSAGRAPTARRRLHPTPPLTRSHQHHGRPPSRFLPRRPLRRPQRPLCHPARHPLPRASATLPSRTGWMRTTGARSSTT